MRSLLYFLAGVLLVAVVALWVLKQKTVASYGPSYNIIHLELPESEAQMNELIAESPEGAKALILRQLNFDYLFMVGGFGGLMVLCLLARRRIGDMNTAKKQLGQAPSGGFWIKVLTALALFQLLAWGLDMWENATLERWFQAEQINTSFKWFTTLVYFKFLLAFAALGTAAGVLLGTVGKLKSLREKVDAKPALA